MGHPHAGGPGVDRDDGVVVHEFVQRRREELRADVFPLLPVIDVGSPLLCPVFGDVQCLVQVGAVGLLIDER